MKIIDPHVDISDMYKYQKWDIEDFYSTSGEPWVTKKKIEDSDIGVMGMTLYFDESFLTTSYYDGVKSFYDFYQRLFAKQPEDFHPIFDRASLDSWSQESLGYFYSIEGFQCLRTPADFEDFFNLGVRSFGFTWSYENDYAHGRHSTQDSGMTKKGIEVIHMMNQKKLIVDIAHLSEHSVKDLDRYFKGMIVSTHTNLRSVYDTTHNVSDDEVQIIVDRGGVVSLFPLVEDTGPEGTFDDLYRHFDYLVSRWGIDYVGICSDIYPLPEYPFLHHYNDIRIMRKLQDYFQPKLTEEEFEKLFIGNWMRVMQQSF